MMDEKRKGTGYRSSTKALLLATTVIFATCLITVGPVALRIFVSLFVSGIEESCEIFQGHFGVKIVNERSSGANYKRVFYLTDNTGADWIKVHEIADEDIRIVDNCAKVRLTGDTSAVYLYGDGARDRILPLALTPEAQK